MYCGRGAQAVRHRRNAGGEVGDEQVGGGEGALIRGAQYTGEDLLGCRAASGAIATAAHFARDDGRPQRVLSAPIRGVERRVKGQLETLLNLHNSML
jgi:hypothetical protein